MLFSLSHLSLEVNKPMQVSLWRSQQPTNKCFSFFFLLCCCFFVWDWILFTLTGLELTTYTRLAWKSQSSTCLCSPSIGMKDKQAVLVSFLFHFFFLYQLRRWPGKPRVFPHKQFYWWANTQTLQTNLSGFRVAFSLAASSGSFPCPLLCYVAFWFVVFAWLLVFIAVPGMEPTSGRPDRCSSMGDDGPGLFFSIRLHKSVDGTMATHHHVSWLNVLKRKWKWHWDLWSPEVRQDQFF